MRFRPAGNRTFSAAGRAGGYGIGNTEHDVLASANREVMIILQVEEKTGIDNLDSILAVPNVDALQIGPKDLWQSMNFTNVEEVWTLIEDALRRIRKSGHWGSMLYWMGEDANKEKMPRYGRLGVQMLSVPLKDVIVGGAKSFLQKAHATAGLQSEAG